MTVNQIKRAEYCTKALFFACGMSFASWASRIPDLKERLGLGDAALGTVLFAMPIGSICALPIAGIMIDKFSSRNITLVSTIFYLIAMPLLGFAASFWELAFALFIFGFGGDLLNIAMNVQAVGVEKLQKRSIMNNFHGIFSIGFMLGAFTGGFIAKANISTSIHLSTIGFIDFLLGISCFSYLLKTDDKPNEPQPIFAIPDKSLIILGVICFCGMLSEGAIADWSVIYYKKLMSNPQGFATAGFTSFSILMVIGRLAGDKLVLKWGISKTLIFNNLLLCLGMAIVLLFENEVLAIIGFAITGLGISTIVPLIYSECGHSKTMSPGVALAAISTVGISGFLLGPVFIGFISEASSLRFALGLLILLGAIGAWISRKVV
jgi:MFS family permease